MITQSEANQLFSYVDGVLYWKISRSNRVRIGMRVGAEDSNGYQAATINHKHYKTHRLIFLMHHGWLPSEIDHIDNNPRNNKIENLRPTTRRQNQFNARARADNTSGVKNVVWAARNKKWRVQVRHANGRYIKYIADLELAALVAEEARDKYHGNFAKN
jgi:hypothetical protein